MLLSAPCSSPIIFTILGTTIAGDTAARTTPMTGGSGCTGEQLRRTRCAPLIVHRKSACKRLLYLALESVQKLPEFSNLYVQALYFMRSGISFLLSGFIESPVKKVESAITQPREGILSVPELTPQSRVMCGLTAISR